MRRIHSERRTVLHAEPQDGAGAPSKPGERLFEFRRGSDHYACELRDHREFGIEDRFLLNGDLYIARTFQDQPALGVRVRDLSIARAEQERKAMS